MHGRAPACVDLRCIYGWTWMLQGQKLDECHRCASLQDEVDLQAESSCIRTPLGGHLKRIYELQRVQPCEESSPATQAVQWGGADTIEMRKSPGGKRADSLRRLSLAQLCWRRSQDPRLGGAWGRPALEVVS